MTVARQACFNDFFGFHRSKNVPIISSLYSSNKILKINLIHKIYFLQYIWTKEDFKEVVLNPAKKRTRESKIKPVLP